MALPFHAEQHVLAAPEVVWAFIQDVGRAGRWMRGTERMEELTRPPLAVGSRFLQTRRIQGHVASAEFVVTDLDPLRRRLSLEVDGRTGSLGRGVFRFRYAMDADGRGGTRVIVDGEIAELGRAVELLARLFVRSFVRVVESDLDALRACLDDGDADDAAPDVTTSSTSRDPST